MNEFDVVIPTIGRPSLDTLLALLALNATTQPGNLCKVVVVDDRPEPTAPRRNGNVEHTENLGVDLLEVRGRARGPAAARNTGWRRCEAPWVVFLDDDVEIGEDWIERLMADLDLAAGNVAAVQARLEVPLGHPLSPDESELATAQLADARWITADMAVRREALVDVDGFDERFPRAYREDTDLALRLMNAGWNLGEGQRISRHPVQPSRWTASLGRQRGNSDDALMRRLHGADWRTRGSAPAGLLRDHVVTTALLFGSTLAHMTGRRRIATALGAGWALRWWRFLRLRRTSGRDGVADTVRLALTTAAIPPLASWWRLTGAVRAWRLVPAGHQATSGNATATPHRNRGAVGPPGTIVMATKNRSHRVADTLGRLRDNGPDWPVVVVDDGSSDGTSEVVSAVAEGRRPRSVRLLRLEESRGAAARNAGMFLADTPLVAFVDDDSWWAPGALDAAVRMFDAHPELGVVAASVLVGDEHRLDPIVHDQLDSPLGRSPLGPRVLGFLAGAVVVRTEAFLEVGGFADIFGIGGEEELLAIDLRERGWDLVLAPELVAHHHPEPRGPQAHREGAARRTANHLLVTWMRRPALRALAVSSALLARSTYQRSAREAIRIAWSGLRPALARRQPVPAWLEAELRSVERHPPRPGGSEARRVRSGASRRLSSR